MLFAILFRQIEVRNKYSLNPTYHKKQLARIITQFERHQRNRCKLELATDMQT